MVGIPVIRILNITMTGFFRTEFRAGDKCWSIKKKKEYSDNVQIQCTKPTSSCCQCWGCSMFKLWNTWAGRRVPLLLSVRNSAQAVSHTSCLLCNCLCLMLCSLFCFFTRVYCMKLWSFTRFSGFYQSITKINLLKIMFSELSYVILSDILI